MKLLINQPKQTQEQNNQKQLTTTTFNQVIERASNAQKQLKSITKINNYTNQHKQRSQLKYNKTANPKK